MKINMMSAFSGNPWMRRLRLATMMVLAVGSLLFFFAEAFAQVWCPGAQFSNPPNEPPTYKPPTPPPNPPPDPPTYCPGPECGDLECKKCSSSPGFLRSGDYMFSVTDLQLPTRGLPITVNRSYESLYTLDGLFGWGWKSNLTMRLVYVVYLYAAPSTYVKQAFLLKPDGIYYRFIENVDGSFTAPVGSHDKLIKNPDGSFDLTQQLSRMRYHFDSYGFLQSVVDDYGNALNYSYDGSNRLSQITDGTGSGRYIVITYGADGRISAATDSANRSVIFEYSPQATLTKVTDAEGRTTNYTYVQGRFNLLLSQIKDHWNRVITDIVYDSNDRLTSYTDAGERWTYTYKYLNDPFKTSRYDLLNKTWIYTMNSDGLVTQVAAPNALGTKTTTFYSDASIDTVVDEVGVKTKYTYNANGSVATITRDYQGTGTGSSPIRFDYLYDPNFPEKVISITPKNPTTGVVDPNWQAWRYEYYQSGNLAPGALFKVIRVQNNGVTLDTLATYTYNSAGQVSTVTDATGGVTTYSYDPLTGDLISVTYPRNSDAGANPVYQYGHDHLGRVTTVTDPIGKITTYTYDDLDRISTVTLPKPTPSSPLNFITTYTYDNFDAVTGLIFTHQTDPNGKLTKQGFDQFGQLRRSVDALNATTIFGYTKGLLTSITDANNNVTSYTYDDKRRLMRTTFPETTTENYTYSNDNLLTRIIDRWNTTFLYEYDHLKRMTKKTFPGNKTMIYSYTGQNLTQVIDNFTSPAETHTYTYDSSYRVATNTQAWRGTLTYAYDPSDRMASYTLSGGPSAGYTYYADGSMRTIQWSPVAGNFQFNYRLNGQYSSVVFPNGQHRDYSYDDKSRLLQLANIHPTTGNLATYNYGYDVDHYTGQSTMLGQRTNLIANVPAQGFVNAQTKYYYDANYQLTRTDYPSVAPYNAEVHQWTYDSIGNRLTNTVNSTTKNYTYFKNGANPNNGQRLSNDGVIAYSYNPNGGTYGGWNVAMQMANVGGTTNTYKYDFAGRRTSKKIVNSTTEYIYDGLNVIAERGALLADFVFGPGIDEPLAMLRAGQVYYYAADGLGSIGSINNTTGTVQNTYAYDVWGVLRNQTGTLGNPFGYTSREFGENGLLYYRARYYKPDIGRFISEDPFRFRADTSFYRYVANRPLVMTDPSGLCDLQVRCRPIRGERWYEKAASILGDHCYILATDRDEKFLQISAGAPDRTVSLTWTVPANEGTEPQHQTDKCIRCHNNRPLDVPCDKVDCLVKKAKEYDGRHGYDALASTAPNSNSFVGWVMAVCGMRIHPKLWTTNAVGCFYWTGE